MNNVLYLDKPAGMTSFDVCFALRKVFGTKKIGHTGTLDPSATGVMIILLDKATKANQFLVSDRKEYIAEILLGVETDTLDLDGNVLERQKVTPFSKQRLHEVLQSFIGKTTQVPPLTSAIKVHGKKLYEYQRQGKEVEIPVREIEIYSCELLALNDDSFVIKVEVSSGTYIRSLARDIAKKLNNIACLKSLRRTKIDHISVESCNSLSTDKENFVLHNVADLLSRRFFTIDVADETEIIHGKKMKLNTEEPMVFLKKDQQALAIYRREEDGFYHSVRGLF